jgi:hypothetical protein
MQPGKNIAALKRCSQVRILLHLRDAVRSKYCYIKGPLAWNFVSLVFFHKNYPAGLLIHSLIFFFLDYELNFSEIFEFEAHSAYNQNMWKQFESALKDFIPGSGPIVHVHSKFWSWVVLKAVDEKNSFWVLGFL